MKSLDGSKTIPSKFEIFADQGSYHATVTETVDGKTDSYDDTADFSQEKIRPNLDRVTDENIDELNLNLGERLIVHAMLLTSDPAMSDLFNAGMDLKAVRSVKIYTIGAPAQFGIAAIVEAQDESGKDLGSFLGGFIVSPCK
jgi:hypothetical protein